MDAVPKRHNDARACRDLYVRRAHGARARFGERRGRRRRRYRRPSGRAEGCGHLPRHGRRPARPDTEEALVSFQERAGLVPDGIAGPRTRRALGDLGRPELGSRPLTIGARGWDVAELQFKLAWHGFPSGPFDGAFGPRLEAAVRRFQRFADLPMIGVAGPRTMAALRQSAADEPARPRRAGRRAAG